MKFLILLFWLVPVAVMAVGIDVENNEITISLQVEPPNLDYSLTEDTTSAAMLRMTNEGLTRINQRGRVEPAVAESWTMDDREVIFKIREEAVWEDGVPVTAHDFVFSWRRLVDPKTGAAGSAFYAYVLENAEAIQRGEKPKESLGVEAIDDKTLRVTLSRPVPYILNVMANTGYLPIRQDFYDAQKGRFYADAENMLSNGPFKMESWVHNSSIRMVRNPRFWNQKEISLEAFNVGYITSDVRSMLNVYRSGELAMLVLNEEILGDAMDAALPIKRNPSGCLAWLFVNTQEGRVTGNLKVRQALRMAFDRDHYVNTIVGLPGTRKLDTVFTQRIRGVKARFQNEYPPTKIEFNIEKAKALLEEAKQEMGVDTLPPITLLANETRQIEAEFIQGQLGNALGIEIRVDQQTFKQALVKMANHDFDLARAGFCGGSIMDPVFYAGVFTSDSPFNDSDYKNAEYDRNMQITHFNGDQKVRMDAFGKMQSLLYEDAPVIPIFEGSTVYVQDPRLKGVIRYPLVDYSRAYFTN